MTEEIIVNQENKLISPNKSVAFWEGQKTVAWQSDNSRPWGNLYSKTERFTQNWDFTEVEHRE